MTPPADPAGPWKILGSEPLASTPHLALHEERVATPTRPDGVNWFIVRRPPAAVVAPRLPDGRFVLIRQERPAVRLATWEFPAGQVEGDPTPGAFRETAIRELREEAGLVCAGPLVALGAYYSSVGFTDERAEIFLASPCHASPDGHAHDEHEAITATREVSPAELARMIADGEIFDANTLCAFARMKALGLLP